MRTTHALPSPRCQRGVYAIEFAMVFMIFFSLLYGSICYGMLFAFRLSVQNAAEDGARAALRYQSTFQDRQGYAETIAKQRVNWLPTLVARKAEATFCGVESKVCGPQSCGPKWQDRCQMVVTVTASNMRGLLPPLPAFAVPDSIVGKASMLLDGRAP